MTIEQSRIFFIGVEFRRIHHPSSHQLTVGSRHKAFFHFHRIQLREKLIVHGGEFFHLLACRHAEYFVRLAHRVTQGEHVAVGGRNHIGVVELTIGNSVDSLSGNVDAEHRYGAFERSHESNSFLIGGPRYFVHRVIPVGGEVGFHARLHIHDENAVLVALIAVVFHREPSEIFSRLGENGVSVVAHHTFGEVLGALRFKVILV